MHLPLKLWLPFVLILAAGGGLWAWQGTKQDAQPLGSSPSEVEGWQAYRNEEYGFEVRYPALGQKQQVTKRSSENFYDVQYWSGPAGFFIDTFGFRVDDNPQKQNLDTWFTDDFCNQPLLENGYFIRTSTNGYPALIQTGKSLLDSGYDVDDCGPRSDIFFIMSPDKTRIVSFHLGHDHDLDIYGYTNDNLDELFRQILSTFRFIE